MSGMHLLPAYFTTTNTRKRKTNKKSKSLLEAERKHAKFLAKHCGKPGGANDTKVTSYHRQSQALAEGSIPSLPPLSNTIPVGATGKRKTTEHNFTIAPAYNKGAYQVISREDIKDIGR